MANASKTIDIQSWQVISVEAKGSGAITPGHLLERTSTDLLKVHATAGGNMSPIVAFESELDGQDITDIYADGDRIFARYYRPGDRVLMIVEDGSAAIVIGDFVESAGNGNIQLHVPDTESLGADSSASIASFLTNQIVGVALEAVDASDSATTSLANRRIVIEII